MQDWWQERALLSSHIPVLLLLMLLHDQRIFQETQLDRDTARQWNETAENSPTTVSNVFSSEIAFTTRKYSQFKHRAKGIGNYSVLTQTSFTSLGSIHCSSSACKQAQATAWPSHTCPSTDDASVLCPSALLYWRALGCTGSVREQVKEMPPFSPQQDQFSISVKETPSSRPFVGTWLPS